MSAKPSDANEQWKSQYIEVAGWNSSSQKSRAGPSMSLFDQFLMQQERRFASANVRKDDSQRRSVAEWLQTRSVKLEVKRECYKDAIWRWMLVKSYVLQRDYISGYVPQKIVVSRSHHAKTVVRRGVPPPMPPAVPPPFEDPVTSFQHLVAYRTELAEYLSSEWVPIAQKRTQVTPLEELQQLQERIESGTYGKLPKIEIPPSAAVETTDEARPYIEKIVTTVEGYSNLTEDEREALDGEEKRRRMHRYGERIRDGLVFAYAPTYRHPFHEYFEQVERENRVAQSSASQKAARSNKSATPIPLSSGSPTRFGLHCPGSPSRITMNVSDLSPPPQIIVADFSFMNIQNVFEILQNPPRRPRRLVSQSTENAERPESRSANETAPPAASEFQRRTTTPPKASSAKSRHPIKKLQLKQHELTRILADVSDKRRQIDQFSDAAEEFLRDAQRLEQEANELEQAAETEVASLRSLATAIATRAMSSPQALETKDALDSHASALQRGDQSTAASLREQARAKVQLAADQSAKRDAVIRELKQIENVLSQGGAAMSRMMRGLLRTLDEYSLPLDVSSEKSKEDIRAAAEIVQREKLMGEVDKLRYSVDILETAVRHHEEEAERLEEKASQCRVEAAELERVAELESAELHALIDEMPTVTGAAETKAQLESSALEVQVGDETAAAALRAQARVAVDHSTKHLSERGEVLFEKLRKEEDLREKMGQVEAIDRTLANLGRSIPFAHHRSTAAQKRISAQPSRQGVGLRRLSSYALFRAASGLSRRRMTKKGSLFRPQREATTLFGFRRYGDDLKTSSDEPEVSGTILHMLEDFENASSLTAKERRARQHKTFGQLLKSNVDKIPCHHVKLDNNGLCRTADNETTPKETADPSSFSFLTTIFKHRFEYISAITSVDLSQNKLEVFPVELFGLPNLTMVHLQGNRIRAWEPLFAFFRIPLQHIAVAATHPAVELDAPISRRSPSRHSRRNVPLKYTASTFCTFRCQLERLAMHGNPIERDSRELYKRNLFNAFPFLRELDFVHITKDERSDMFSPVQLADLDAIFVEFCRKRSHSEALFVKGTPRFEMVEVLPAPQPKHYF